jgi:hypothetical protein
VKNVFLVSILGFFICCNSPSGSRPLRYDPSLYGYWIPDSIIWKSTNSGHLDMDTVQRYASFKMLHFDSSNHIEIWGATFSYPRAKYDSIIFEFEPGVDIYHGTWDIVQDKIQMNYAWVYSGFGKPDKLAINDTIGISYSGSDTLLTFQHKEYKKTQRLNNFSLRKIDAYRNEAGLP